jgi:hypothetical protein
MIWLKNYSVGIKHQSLTYSIVTVELFVFYFMYIIIDFFSQKRFLFFRNVNEFLLILSICIAHWNNSLSEDMSLHFDTLSSFGAHRSLFFLLNDVCLAEKQLIPILLSVIWPKLASNSKFTALSHTDAHDMAEKLLSWH